MSKESPTLWQLCEEAKDSNEVLIIRKKGNSWMVSHSPLINAVESLGAVKLLERQIMKLLKSHDEIDRETVKDMIRASTEIKK